MNNQIIYNTKQRNAIINVLHENEDAHLTAEEIYTLLKEQNASVGRATLYRFLDYLVTTNKVTKYLATDNTISYQYLDCEHDGHYHLKCEKCGNLIHVKCNEFQKFFDHLEEEHNFSINPNKVFVLGLCEKCQKEGEDNEEDSCHCH